jgi:hypothetical protein
MLAGAPLGGVEGPATSSGSLAAGPRIFCDTVVMAKVGLGDVGTGADAWITFWTGDDASRGSAACPEPGARAGPTAKGMAATLVSVRMPGATPAGSPLGGPGGDALDGKGATASSTATPTLSSRPRSIHSPSSGAGSRVFFALSSTIPATGPRSKPSRGSGRPGSASIKLSPRAAGSKRALPPCGRRASTAALVGNPCRCTGPVETCGTPRNSKPPDVSPSAGCLPSKAAKASRNPAAWTACPEPRDPRPIMAEVLKRL